jgi:sigma54-dependent transcription regulator
MEKSGAIGQVDLGGGPRRNLQVFSLLNFLAENTQYDPDIGEHLVGYTTGTHIADAAFGPRPRAKKSGDRAVSPMSGTLGSAPNRPRA